MSFSITGVIGSHDYPKLHIVRQLIEALAHYNDNSKKTEFVLLDGEYPVSATAFTTAHDNELTACQYHLDTDIDTGEDDPNWLISAEFNIPKDIEEQLLRENPETSAEIAEMLSGDDVSGNKRYPTLDQAAAGRTMLMLTRSDRLLFFWGGNEDDVARIVRVAYDAQIPLFVVGPDGDEILRTN